MPQPLPRTFYNRPVTDVARDLLGMRLVRRDGRRTLSGWIVETEAYLGSGDSACHASRGETRRNRVMFGPPGHGYVYVIHARHCFNIVTEAPGIASAVLVRAIDPQVGLPLMRERRRAQRDRDLTSGPAKLCEALAIDRDFDGHDLTRGVRLWVETGVKPDDIGVSTRIGVTSAHDHLLRFYWRGNAYVSGSGAMRQ